MNDDLDPDVAAELRLLRAEITALRNAPPVAAPRHIWLPGRDEAGHLILPERHYRLMGSLRRWLHRRTHAGPLPRAKISRQRRLAIWLTVTSAARVLIWAVAMVLIVLYWGGLHGSLIHWFAGLSGKVIFVTFISFYCNAATDGASLTASISALFSADSHAAVVAAGAAATADISSLEGDIARLADLQPGPEATALAADIRERLAGRKA